MRDLDVVYLHKARDPAELATAGGRPTLLAAHDHDLTCARAHRYLPLGNAPCHRAPGVACVAFGCALVRDREGPLPVRLVDPRALVPKLRALTDAATIVACSEYVAAGLRAAGAPSKRLRVIHPAPPEVTAARVTPRDPRRLLVAGQLLRGKGVDLAVRALAMLPSDFSLDVVGDGPERASLEALAHALCPTRVRFIGYVAPEAITARYDDAAMVLVPSRWPEPFGMTGIEAMRRARPVVGADHGGIPEWLPDGVGARFTPGDPEDLARAVLRVTRDANAPARALEHAARFSHTRMIDAVEALLREIATPARNLHERPHA